jgi:hypothetical protein
MLYPLGVFRTLLGYFMESASSFICDSNTCDSVTIILKQISKQPILGVIVLMCFVLGQVNIHVLTFDLKLTLW